MNSRGQNDCHNLDFGFRVNNMCTVAFGPSDQIHLSVGMTSSLCSSGRALLNTLVERDTQLADDALWAEGLL